jgi:hypothetical protein
MLSKRALGLAVGLAVLPQMVHASESAARCVDASVPRARRRIAPRQMDRIDVRAVAVPSRHLCDESADKAALVKIDGSSGGMVFFIDGDKACTPMEVPDQLLAMSGDVATAKISHDGSVF